MNALNINIEYKNEYGDYPTFYNHIKDKTISAIFDINTKPFALNIIERIKKYSKEVIEIYFPLDNLVPNESIYERVIEESKGSDYILAIGSGSLNDIAKYSSTKLNISCGCLATAASMDGYISKGAALMEKDFKVTETVHTPSDILIDLDVLLTAPKIMTASGFGDIIGKYTCLLDWRLSNILNNEEINFKAYSLMEEALNKCVSSYKELALKDKNAVSSLIDALLTAGLSMAISGNSRPASGSEHHISHYLEMDFVRRKIRVPEHGIKVALGALVSIEIYNYIKDNKIKFDGCEKVYELVGYLPKINDLIEIYNVVGIPTRFSSLGISENLLRETLLNAYTVRERFTVLTLAHNIGLMPKIVDMLVEKYL